jgi:toxin YoeB
VRINQLIRECLRDPFRGIGKPEPLRGNLAGYWSRRINDRDRLVYRVRGDDLEIIACRYHYA